MATRLLNAGHDVTVWNRSVPRTAPLAQAGASVAVTPAQAATGVEFAITMLATPEALDHVLFGPEHCPRRARRRAGPTVRAMRANVEAGRYPPSFKLSLAAKDMRLAVDAAQHAGAPLKTAETVSRWLDEAADDGAADLDFSAVVATILGLPARP